MTSKYTRLGFIACDRITWSGNKNRSDAQETGGRCILWPGPITDLNLVLSSQEMTILSHGLQEEQ